MRVQAAVLAKPMGATALPVGGLGGLGGVKVNSTADAGVGVVGRPRPRHGWGYTSRACCCSWSPHASRLTLSRLTGLRH